MRRLERTSSAARVRQLAASHELNDAVVDVDAIDDAAADDDGVRTRQLSLTNEVADAEVRTLLLKNNIRFFCHMYVIAFFLKKKKLF